MNEQPGPSPDPSAFAEPQLRGLTSASVGGGNPCWKCGYDRTGARVDTNGVFRCPECGATEFDASTNPADAADASVWDEPSTAAALAGPVPTDAVRYSTWLASQRAAMPRWETWCITLALGVAAGPWALIGAFVGEGGTGGWFSMAAAIFVVPMLQEVMKVAAVTYAVERRPYWFSSRGQLLLCCLASGVAFSGLDLALQATLRFSGPSAAIEPWRLVAMPAMHGACSVIAGLGLVRVWQRTMATLERPELNACTPWVIAAIALHAVYNALLIAFELTGAIN